MALDRIVKLGIESGILIIAPKQKIDAGDWQDLDFKDAIYINNHYTNIKKVFEMSKVINHIIIDEAHLLKNFKTKGWIYLEKIIQKYKPSTTWLSATPTSRGLIDYYPFLSTLLSIDFNKEITTAGLDKKISIYEKQKFNYADYPIKTLVGYRNEDKFKKIIKIFSFEKLEMPKDYEVKSEVVNFKQPKDINVIRKTNIFEGEVIESPVKKWNIIRRINNKEKIDFIKRLEHRNIIIFTNYKSEVEFLKENLENYGIIDGSNKIDLTDKEKYKYIIVNYKSGSAALNLQHATCCIHYSPTCNYTDHIQSLGRIDRVGQKASAIEIFTFCQSYIDRQIIDCLSVKKDYNINKFLVEI